MAKVDVPSTIAAVLAFAQAAAAVIGVLALARSAQGIFDIPAIEQVGVGILTILVAAALGVGCVRVLTGGSPRVIAGASTGSLVISAYWILLRPQAEGFPAIAVAYAVVPVLILGVLALSRAQAAIAGRTAPPAEPADRDAGDAISA